MARPPRTRHGADALNLMGVARLRRVLLTACAIAAFIVLAGATYQGVATALERRRFPHPGRLVNVGGHQLHINCVGDGAPTVVLEAPATGMSAAWTGVQPEISRLTRVCSYDRAGLGWSEAGDRPYDPAGVAVELHALLEGAEEAGPHILAGHGLGAALATVYAARFGPSVAGLVLIDPPAAEPVTGGGPMLHVSPWLARTGVLRAARTMSRNAAGLPTGALAAFLNRPDHLTRAAVELSRWDDAVALAARATLDPHIVVARTEAAGPGRAALLGDANQARQASDAIRGVVERVRAGTT